MATKGSLRGSGRRPMGVYAPPHLRDLKIGESSQSDRQKEEGGVVVPNNLVSADCTVGATREHEEYDGSSRRLQTPVSSPEKRVNGSDEKSDQETGKQKIGKSGSSKGLRSEDKKGYIRKNEKEDNISLSSSMSGAAEDQSSSLQKSKEVSNQSAAQNKMYQSPIPTLERQLDEGWLQWLERLITGADIQMDALVAIYINGLLEMENGEGPGEKQAALAEFLSAMLPASSSQSPQQDLSENAAQSSSEARGEAKEESAKERKVTWMVSDIWGAWIDWGRALVQGEQTGGVEDKEEDFGAWLSAKMWALGLDPEVCAPYVAGLLELEEDGSAIAEFLADAALQDESGTLRFDPVAETDQILARFRVQVTTDQAPAEKDDLNKDAPGPEKGGPKKGKGKRYRKTVPVDLFSHWWASDDLPSEAAPDWGASMAASEGGTDDWNACGSPSEYDDYEDFGGREGQSRGSVGRACEYGGDEGVSGRSKTPKVSSKLPNGYGVGTLSGAGYSRPAEKPPTSVVVARRMILHILGLKDPNRRKH